MTPKLWNGLAAISCMAALAMLGFVSSACALDAYWVGARNNNWNVGPDPNNEVSNWYREPGGQVPVRVPDRTAIFAGTIQREPQVVGTTTIGRIRVEPDTAPFTIAIVGFLIVNGAGIVNQSDATPLFHIAGDMEFHGDAELRSAGARSAFFRLVDANDAILSPALLSFRDNSKGGNARVETLHSKTIVQFRNEASAQNMVIDNLFGRADFLDRSTGGDAELVNHLHGTSEFDSIGPKGNGNVTIGAVRNDGRLDIGGRTTLVVRRDLVLDAFQQGKVRFPIRNGRAGNIIVGGKTRLGGDLIVDGFHDHVALGEHRLITATDGLTGRFRAHRLVQFPANRRGRIVYSGKAVTLVVEPR